MWQAPNHKAARGGTGPKKGAIERNRRTIHFKRVGAEMRAVADKKSLEPGPAIAVRVFLNDLAPLTLALFSTQALCTGQEVAVVINEPSMIYLRAQVTFCQEHDPNCHIISEQRYAFRIGLKLIFESPTEAEAVKKYCAEIMQILMYPLAA